MNTYRSTTRSGVQLVSAFSSCSEDPKNSDGGYITGLAIDQAHNILAVDNDGGVVKVFDQMGAFKYSFGKGLLIEPWDIFITSSGKIAVSDPGAGDLKVFSKSGKYLLRSEKGFHLHEPYGVDYHPWTKETVIVDKTFSCVYVHGPNGTVKDIVTKHGRNENEASLKQPNYVSFDYAGNMYVTDREEQSLHAYDPEHQHMFTYGHSKHDEDLNNPSGVVIDRYGNILVADRGQSRVHLLNKHGRRKLCVLTWEDGIVEPQALAITLEGHLVLSEGSTGLIKIFGYTHLPGIMQDDIDKTHVTEKQDDVKENDDEVISNDDGVSLKSNSDEETPKQHNSTEDKPVKSILCNKSKSPTTTDVESFKRSLQMLTDDPTTYNKSLGFPVNSKSGWSQMSSQNFSSVPSTAAPRGPFGPKSSKNRLAELNKEFENRDPKAETEQGILRIDVNGLSISTPNIRAISPVGLLVDGGKHLSDFTRPVFKLTGDTPRSTDVLSALNTSKSTLSIVNTGRQSNSKSSILPSPLSTSGRKHTGRIKLV